MTTLTTFRMPLRTRSASNLREHWATRARRTKNERTCTRFWGHSWCAEVTLPVLVVLTRIAPRGLDDDNLRGCLKGIRDELAKLLKLKDDRDPRVIWAYSQERGDPKEYAVRVTIEDRP